MSPQSVCPGGCKVTLVAFVWLFSTVCFEMPHQRAFLRGCIVTLVAFVWFVILSSFCHSHWVFQSAIVFQQLIIFEILIHPYKEASEGSMERERRSTTTLLMSPRYWIFKLKLNIAFEREKSESKIWNPLCLVQAKDPTTNPLLLLVANS